MTSYCKSNVRRVINYTNKEPLNRYDLWLSENKRYNEDGSIAYDNEGLPACDLILKVFRNGRWEPIVGYNTTSAFKINTVDGVTYTPTDCDPRHGKNEFHPAIFTKDTPGELYDAGTLGELLSDTHFVNQSDWYKVFNGGIYNWNTILGDLIINILEDPSSGFDLWPADTNRIGGIFADRFNSTHADSSTSGETWLAQCKYKYNDSDNYNLYIHAKDIVTAVNTYTTENPNAPGIQPGGDFEWRLATHENIGGINAQVDTTYSDYRGLPVLRGGPQCGLTYGDDVPSGFTLYGDSLTYNPENTFLYIPGWAIQSWLNDPTGTGTVNPYNPSQIVVVLDTLLKNTSSIGWNILTTSSNPSVSPEIWGVGPGNKGKYLRIKDPFPSIGDGWSLINNALEWVDIPAGTTYTGTNLIKVDAQNSTVGIDITTNVPQGGDVITYDQGVVKWAALPDPVEYTNGIGISKSIVSGRHEFSQHTGSVTNTLTSDDHTIEISYDNVNNIYTVSGDEHSVNLDFYLILDLSSIETSIRVSSISNLNEPVYLKISIKNASDISFQNDTDTINFPVDGGLYLVTIRFGIVKFEKYIHTTATTVTVENN